MSLPIDVHLEAQLAVSNRAKCFVCGEVAKKGTMVLKVLGFRINKTVHADCLGKLFIALKQTLDSGCAKKSIRCSGKGVLKVGEYKKQNGKYRWNTDFTLFIKPEVEEKPSE